MLAPESISDKVAGSAKVFHRTPPVDDIFQILKQNKNADKTKYEDRITKKLDVNNMVFKFAMTAISNLHYIL